MNNSKKTKVLKIKKTNKYKIKKNSIKNKKMVGGNCLILRIKKELEYIEKSEKYEFIKFDNDKCELDLIHKLDKANIKIKLNNYPLQNPIIIINDLIMSQRILDPWNLNERNKNDKDYQLKLLLRKINKYFPDNVNNNNNNNNIKYNKKVLILCHNMKVTGTFKPLKLKNFSKYCNTDINLFDELFGNYNLDGIPKFETVDIIPGGTYIEDAFSRRFIDKHIKEYDLLMVPDCAGPWENLVNKIIHKKHNPFIVERVLELHEINTNKTKLIELCLDLTNMVKPGGIIQFGKFISETPCTINGKEYSKFSEALISVLETNGFKTETKTLEKRGLGLNVIAVKPKNLLSN